MSGNQRRIVEWSERKRIAVEHDCAVADEDQSLAVPGRQTEALIATSMLVCVQFREI
jgi:hypothetical protein